MKVAKVTEDEVEFDNGLTLRSYHQQDCCERNFLDFEQLHVGREFKTMGAGEFADAIRLKEDGFSIKDASGVPAWVQARSYQNGYYGSGVDLVLFDGSKHINMTNPVSYSELFTGKVED